MDVVVKETAGVAVVKLVEVYLAAVGEGGVADVVAQGDGLEL